MELVLEVKFHLDFHWVARPWRRTLTNGSDVKYVFPRCVSRTSGRSVYFHWLLFRQDSTETVDGKANADEVNPSNGSSTEKESRSGRHMSLKGKSETRGRWHRRDWGKGGEGGLRWGLGDLVCIGGWGSGIFRIDYTPGQNMWDTLPFTPNSCANIPQTNVLWAKFYQIPCNVGRLFSKPFLTNNIAWGEGGGGWGGGGGGWKKEEVEFAPKNVCFHVKNYQWSRHCILQACPTHFWPEL